ncbi:hypothetical protein FLA_0483 [Filimonas lacunae]|nr:hypothetical protein FLA_0483 [Filimonas lacunae]
MIVLIQREVTNAQWESVLFFTESMVYINRFSSTDSNSSPLL